MLFRFNSPKTDLHTVWIGDNLGIDLLSPVNSNGFLILSTDNIFFNSEYVQLARGVRRDVTIANLPYLPQHSLFLSYRRHIQKSAPQQSKDYQTLLAINHDHPIFSWSNFEVSKNKAEQFTWIPYGLGYKLADEKDLTRTEENYITQQENIWQTFHLPLRDSLSLSERGLSVINIPAIYAAGLSNIAHYIRVHYSDYAMAKRYYQKAVAVDPEFELGHLGIGFANVALRDCEGAKTAFETVLRINPSSKQGYLGLYVLNQTCLQDTALDTYLQTSFEDLFHQSIKKAATQAILSPNTTQAN
jgi:tetratricopeptide (TPR) repeat protein